MKSPTCALALLILLPLTALQAQQPSSNTAKSSAAPKRTDVYHVFVVKAALGKAKELQDWLKEPDPDHPNAKAILLRHQDGDSWDYIAIEHIGAKATVEIGGTPMTPQQRMLTEWHNDTFVAGPTWSEFAKAMGLDGDAAKTAGSVYVVSDYRAAPGHRDELEKMLSESTPGDTASGNVLFAHIEGASWNFLAVVRYDNWERFAEGEKTSTSQTNKGEGGWFELRNQCALHHDTLTDRIQP
ncbi:MAG TPA: hypothetical protein VH207_08185 [Chthoniobacterales bacterium]|jgi:hypothetical protein|nr:hypothetical protein [Chthoniobacterales bacterium]